MASHAAKNQKHTAAVAKDSRTLPTDEQLYEVIAGASDTRTRRAVRSLCRDVHTAHCDGECPSNRNTEEMRCDGVVGEAVHSAPPRLQPKVDEPKAMNNVVEELWHGPLKPLCGHPYYLTIDASDMRRCGGRSILQVHVYSAPAEKPVLVSTVANNGKANPPPCVRRIVEGRQLHGPRSAHGRGCTQRDGVSVCTAAVRKLQATHKHVQHIKCIAHSVQLCLKRVLDEWAPLA
ncbi:MAG: hypothetical protein EOO65_03930, partial [Methanosarcinales archaeon]